MVGTTSNWEDELRGWLKPFLDRLGHKSRRRMCPLYVAGLIGPGDRKSVQPMAERLAPGDYDQLHHFVAAGVWDAAPLETELLIQADRLVGGSDAVLVIDDTAVPKKGGKAEAQQVVAALQQRLAQVGLELHPDKTRIVYCKDSNRPGSHEHEQFTFLGYTFRPRWAKNNTGKSFVGFVPAVSNQAAKEMRSQIKRWRLHLRSGQSLQDLADQINPIVRGWINYYGRFYPSGLHRTLRRINDYLLRWARRKYKRLRSSKRRAWAWLESLAKRAPTLFAHWRLAGARP